MNEEQEDLVSGLLGRNLVSLVSEVFLLLDPLSLKHARCACRAWNEFISVHLWGGREGRRRLELKLWQLWRSGHQVIQPFQAGLDTIYYLHIDNINLYCGTLAGITEVFDLETGLYKFPLDSRASPQDISRHLVNPAFDPSYRVPIGAERDDNDTEYLQIDAGVGDIVATLTEKGSIGIWEKRTGRLEYQARHHGDTYCFGIKIVSNKQVITAASDGSIFLLAKQECGSWEISKKVYKFFTEIQHIDVDATNDCFVTGTKFDVQIWSLSKMEEGPKEGTIPVSVWMFVLHFPYVYIVGGEEWEGFQVWNVVSRKCMRSIQLNNKKFHTISSSGRFVAITEKSEFDTRDIFVFVFDTRELRDATIADEKLSKRVRICEHDYNNGEVNAALNKNCLVVSHGGEVNIQRMWSSDSVLPMYNQEKI